VITVNSRNNSILAKIMEGSSKKELKF